MRDESDPPDDPEDPTPADHGPTDHGPTGQEPAAERPADVPPGALPPGGVPPEDEPPAGGAGPEELVGPAEPDVVHPGGIEGPAVGRATAVMAVLAKTTRPERSTSIRGSGRRSNTSRASAGKPKAGSVLAAVTWSSSLRALVPRKSASAKQSAAANSIQGADAGHANATAPAMPSPAASQKKALRIPVCCPFC